MQTFYGTFGQQHIHKGQYVRNKFTRIIASDHDKAEDAMFKQYGQKWSSVYREEDFEPSYYPNGELEVIHGE